MHIARFLSAHVTAIGACLGAAACGEPTAPYPLSNVTLDPSPAVVDLGRVTYTDPTMPSETIVLANGTSDALYLAAGTGVETPNASLLSVDLRPYTRVTAQQRWPISVSIARPATNWTSGAYTVVFPLEVTYFFFGQRPGEGGEIPVGGATPTRTGELVDITVKFELDCDLDEDGVDAIECGGTDCDDSNANIRPGADELCATASVDEDCDGGTLDADAIDTVTWYRDNDNDGFGAGTETFVGCRRPGVGWADNDLDCNDDDPSEKPAPAETSCSDGKDNDCDGLTDGADPDCGA